MRCLILSSTLADFVTRENREQGKEIQNSVWRSGRYSAQTAAISDGEKKEKKKKHMTCINHEKDAFEGQQRSFFMAKSRGLVACCNHETHRPCGTLSAGHQQKTD